MKKVKRKPRVCFVLNIAPIYRKALLAALDESEKIDAYFAVGDSDMQISALCDMTQFSGFRHSLKNKFEGTKLVWQRGWFKLLFCNYDIFVLTGNTGIKSNWLLMILARLMGKKCYLWTHGLYGYESVKELFKKMVHMNLASGLLLYGSYGKMQLIKRGYSPNKITVIYNSLDVVAQQKFRKREENGLFLRNYFADNNPIAIFLGRLTPQKSLHLLLEALGVLKLQGIECNCIVVGSGSEETALRVKAQEVGVEENVWFYGECYDEDMIATLFKLSTVCVSPGNVGLTAMHAMTYGIPVITHNRFSMQMPEFEVIRRGITGDFFKYNDAIDLADKIHRWIKLLADEKTKQTTEEKCQKVIDQVYNPAHQCRIITKRLLDSYNS